MKIHQLSLFLENKPGHIGAICRALAQAGLNIVTLSLADTAQFGILRLIIERWQEAKALLESRGFVVNVTEVVATEVEDRPGGLADILDLFKGSGINIEYMYAFTFRRGNRAVLMFRFDDPDRAIGLLQKAGLNIVGQVELFNRMD